MKKKDNYDLKGEAAIREVELSQLDYSPQLPKNYRPRIGLIGCGGITKHHLKAYRQDGLDVVALCDLDRSSAQARKDEFYPAADLYTDYHDMLAREDIDVVDIALHPEPRVTAIEAALKAGKHVLSQKPFVLDLDVGERLAALAREKGVKLAVNQNGRWAPYVRYVTQLIRSGMIGKVQSVNIRMNWDHSWIKGTSFEKIHHVVLYDFAIHWVDMVRLYFGEDRALNVFGALRSALNQAVAAPLLASATFVFENGIGSLQFDAASRKDYMEESSIIVGSEGVIRVAGPNCSANEVSVETAGKKGSIRLEGSWFPDGFRGTMGELLCAIEEDREPENAAEGNLKSLELAFAAIQSADTGAAVIPGEARELGDSCKVMG